MYLFPQYPLLISPWLATWSTNPHKWNLQTTCWNADKCSTKPRPRLVAAEDPTIHIVHLLLGPFPRRKGCHWLYAGPEPQQPNLLEQGCSQGPHTGLKGFTPPFVSSSLLGDSVQFPWDANLFVLMCQRREISVSSSPGESCCYMLYFCHEISSATDSVFIVFAASSE